MTTTTLKFHLRNGKTVRAAQRNMLEPTMDPNVDAKMNELGFTLVGTGGGCSAFEGMANDDGHGWLITDGEVNAPCRFASKTSVHEYEDFDCTGEPLRTMDFVSLNEAIGFLENEAGYFVRVEVRS